MVMKSRVMQKPDRVRKADRRAAIVQAARQRIRDHGLAETTLAMVAEDVKLSRPNLYRFFKDKAELISAVVANEASEINARRQKEVLKLKSFERQITRSLELAVEIVQSDELWSLLVEPGNVPYTAYAASSDPDILASNAEYWLPLLEKAKARGELRFDIDLQEAMTWLLGIQFMFMERREIFPTVKDVRRYSKAFVVPALISK
jgi:AcrR family transcriptional regulator